MIIVRTVLSVRGAVARRRSAGRIGGPGNRSGTMARRSRQLCRRSRADAASCALCLASTRPGGVGDPSGPTTRLCDLLVRWTRDRRRRRNPPDEAVRRHRACPRKHGPDAEQTPRWARREGERDGPQDHRDNHHPRANRRAPTPRCEATGAELGLDGAARGKRRGCLTS